MLNCLKFKSLYSLISKAKDNKLFVLDPKTKVNAERVSSSPQSLARQVWGRGPAGPRRPQGRRAAYHFHHVRAPLRQQLQALQRQVEQLPVLRVGLLGLLAAGARDDLGHDRGIQRSRHVHA